MKTEYSAYSRMKKIGRLALAGITTAYVTGCASMNVRPTMSVLQNDGGELEAKAGLAFTGDPSENPEYHGGFCREACQTFFGPFHVYRFKDGKWFPEFREHPWRTSGMTVLYIGAAALAAGGSSGGGSSSSSSTTTPADNTTPNNNPRTKPNPGDHDDGGTF